MNRQAQYKKDVCTFKMITVGVCAMETHLREFIKYIKVNWGGDVTGNICWNEEEIFTPKKKIDNSVSKK